MENTMKEMTIVPITGQVISETTLFTLQSEGQKSKNGDFMDFLWDTYI